MAVAQRADVPTASDAGGGATSATPAKSSGTAAGDVCYLFLEASNSISNPLVTGFTRLVNALNSGTRSLSVFRRVCDGSEGATYAVSWTTGSRYDISVVTFTGADNTTPEDATTVTNTGSSATPQTAAGGITTVNPNAMLLMGVAGANGSTGRYSAWSSPLVEVVEVGDGSSHTLGVADGIQAAAGSSGTLQVTHVNNSSWVVALIAIRPDAPVAKSSSDSATASEGTPSIGFTRTESGALSEGTPTVGPGGSDSVAASEGTPSVGPASSDLIQSAEGTPAIAFSLSDSIGATDVGSAGEIITGSDAFVFTESSSLIAVIVSELVSLTESAPLIEAFIASQDAITLEEALKIAYTERLVYTSERGSLTEAPVPTPQVGSNTSGATYSSERIRYDRD